MIGAPCGVNKNVPIDDYYSGVFVAWCDGHEHPEDYKKRQEAAGNWKDPRVWSLGPTDSLF